VTAQGPGEGILYERRTRERREARRARRRRVAVLSGATLFGAFLFVFGLALGRALEQAPEPGGTQTGVRTLAPGTAPPATLTVTVTTGSP
jgi:hypothetical protein